MMRAWGVSAALWFSAAACAETVSFDWFEYKGRDAIFEQAVAAGQFRNPILAGFYPDPSITRAGDRFYLVNSTFAYFPGIPVFESTDLVHWTLIGHVIDRPSQLSFDGLGMSRGVFAPAIEHHNGVFYVLNTAVGSGGNFLSTARNPAGPWSDPVWLKEIDGIDPSLFIDADGRAYVLNNGPPNGKPLYDGHRAIWMQEIDLAARKLIGPRKVLVNGGVELKKKPIWIEGPHVYRRAGWYYLLCAEGGTGPGHSEVIFRSRSVWGPYVPYSGNPILSQRDLPAERPQPITNAGHADLVEAPDGSWWAVFLASRPYEGDRYNTGRETFLLPVTWKDGWPVILEQGRAIPYVVPGPKFLAAGDQAPLSGNFTWRDEFDGAALNPAWVQARVPKAPWFDFTSTPGALTLDARTVSLDSKDNPSFLGRRQQHASFDASTAVHVPSGEGVAAGLAAFQSESYWYFLGVRRTGEGVQVFLEKKAGESRETVQSAALAGSTRLLALKVTGDGGSYAFFYDADGKGWQALARQVDGSILSTEVAGGFIGATLGPYARKE